ncbi:MAG TPA: T9SS type A sorting domain-containing protein [Ignavibacteria bacterium]
MKKLIYSLAFVFIVCCTLKIDNCMSQWVQISNGIGASQTIESFASSENYIFAGTYGVYVSTNNGSNWTQTSLNNEAVKALVVSGSNIFAGTNNGIYRSTNKGNSWTQFAFSGVEILSIAFSGNYILAGTVNYGMYLSTNNGNNWNQTNLNEGNITSIVLSGNNIFAGKSSDYPIYYGGVFRSTDNGYTWTWTSLQHIYVTSIAVTGNNIFAGVEVSGVYSSTNDGNNWTQTGLNNKNVYSLATIENNIFAGTYQYGVYLSKDNGTNWVQKNQGFNLIPSVHALLIANNYIFAGTSGQSVWRRDLSEITGIQNISTEIPSQFSLSQNYPNPFNPTTVINFQLSVAGQVVLKVYDVMGREVQTLVNESLKPGTYEASFDGSQLTSGVYFYKLSAGDFSETKKMLMVK